MVPGGAPQMAFPGQIARGWAACVCVCVFLWWVGGACFLLRRQYVPLSAAGDLSQLADNEVGI